MYKWQRIQNVCKTHHFNVDLIWRWFGSLWLRGITLHILTYQSLRKKNLEYYFHENFSNWPAELLIFRSSVWSEIRMMNKWESTQRNICTYVFSIRTFVVRFRVPKPGSFTVQIALAKEPGSQPVTFHTRSVSHSSSQQRLWKEDLFAFTVHSWYTWLHCPTCWPESTPGACDECDIASHKRCSRLTMKKKRWM